MLTKTSYEHVALDVTHVPVIAGTTMKVHELALAHLAYGWSPAELHFQFPYLSLGQIHSALAYYWDHQAELDHVIAQQLERIETIRQTVGPAPMVGWLKAQGLL